MFRRRIEVRVYLPEPAEVIVRTLRLPTAQAEKKKKEKKKSNLLLKAVLLFKATIDGILFIVSASDPQIKLFVLVEQ